MAPTLLQGYSAFVSGAASGIGMQITLSFIKHGIKKLAIADINGDALDKLADQIRILGPEIEVLRLLMDVQNTSQVAHGFEQIASTFGRLDVAVNNAGVSGNGEMTDEMGDEEFQRVIDVNLFGVHKCQREELRIMKAQEHLGPRQGRGCIINVSSMYGVSVHGIVHQTPYVTSKHGVVGLTRADAIEYAQSGIRINAVCPGYTATSMVLKLLKDESNIWLPKLLERVPMQRLAEPEEVVDSVVFLASTMSSFVTGAALICDGGLSC